ncbi:MAG: hypothetical protein OXJ52_05650 [Oligoflexia bacterium]|nr:hypothetical protein [Oligoflexia bacterium]
MKWFYMDDLIAYYFYRELKNKTDQEQRDRLMPFLLQSDKMDSVLMKFGNYKSLDTGKGLKNASKKSIEVYEQFKNKSLKEIKQAIIQKEKTDPGQSNFFKELSKNL